MAQDSSAKVFPGYVKWSHMIGIFSFFTLVSSGFYGYVLSLHADQPHKGAVRLEALTPINRNISSIQLDIKKIEDSLHKISISVARLESK